MAASHLGDVEDDVLGDGLQGKGEILVVLGERFAAHAGRAEGVEELALEGADHPVAVVVEIAHVDLELAVGRQADEVAHLAGELAAAKRCERHDGAFLEHFVAEVAGDQGVDHAQAVEECALPAPFEAVALAGENAR